MVSAGPRADAQPLPATLLLQISPSQPAQAPSPAGISDLIPGAQIPSGPPWLTALSSKRLLTPSGPPMSRPILKTLNNYLRRRAPTLPAEQGSPVTTYVTLPGGCPCRRDRTPETEREIRTRLGVCNKQGPTGIGRDTGSPSGVSNAEVQPMRHHLSTRYNPARCLGSPRHFLRGPDMTPNTAPVPKWPPCRGHHRGHGVHRPGPMAPVEGYRIDPESCGGERGLTLWRTA